MQRGPGLLQLEATWTVIAQLKRFMYGCLVELAQNVSRGEESWRHWIKQMATWRRDDLSKYAEAHTWQCAYKTMAAKYVVEVGAMPAAAGADTIKIPTIGSFLETVIRKISVTPSITDGTFIDLSCSEQEHVIAETIRVAMSELCASILVASVPPLVEPHESVSVAEYDVGVKGKGRKSKQTSGKKVAMKNKGGKIPKMYY